MFKVAQLAERKCLVRQVNFASWHYAFLHSTFAKVVFYQENTEVL
jgi:hypothetical protein